MALFLPRRWRRQPQYPIRFRQELNVAAGAIQSVVLARDIARGVNPVLFGGGSSPTLRYHTAGIGMVTSSAAQCYAPAYSAPWLTDVFTWVALASVPNNSAYYTLLDTDDYVDGTASDRRHTQFRIDNTTGALTAIRFDTAKNAYSLSGASPATGLPFVAAIRSQGASFDVWVNRVKSSTGTISNTPSGSGQVPARGITVCGGQGGGASTDCIFGGATIYGWLGLGYWASDGLLTELADNFWSAFEPQRRVLYFHGTTGVNQSVDVPLATITVAANAPTVNRTQSVAVPLATVVVAANAPTINQTRSINVPVSNIVVAGNAPTVNRTQSVAVPAANIAVNALAPTVGQGQSISIPAANIVVAANAPTVNRTQSISVPVADIVVNGYAPTVVNSGILPPAALAELYGGNIFSTKGKKKKKKKPELEEMVFAVAKTADGKQAIIKALPKQIQEELPDPQFALVEDLIRKINAASDQVQKKVEAIYQKRKRDEDDEDDIFILLL